MRGVGRVSAPMLFFFFFFFYVLVFRGFHFNAHIIFSHTFRNSCHVFVILYSLSVWVQEVQRFVDEFCQLLLVGPVDISSFPFRRALVPLPCPSPSKFHLASLLISAAYIQAPALHAYGLLLSY